MCWSTKYYCRLAGMGWWTSSNPCPYVRVQLPVHHHQELRAKTFSTSRPSFPPWPYIRNVHHAGCPHHLAWWTFVGVSIASPQESRTTSKTARPRCCVNLQMPSGHGETLARGSCYMARPNLSTEAYSPTLCEHLRFLSPILLCYRPWHVSFVHPFVSYSCVLLILHFAKATRLVDSVTDREDTEHFILNKG